MNPLMRRCARHGAQWSCAASAVFGDHHPRRLAGRTRQGLELIVPAVLPAQVDRRQVLRNFAGAIVRHLAVDDARLHPFHGGVVGVIGHALEHADELVRREVGAHHPLQRMAAHAFDQRALLLGGARHAHEPLGRGELPGNVGDLAQGEVGSRGLFSGYFGRCRCRRGERVADGADLQGIMPGGQAVGREAVAAGAVRHHGNGDGASRRAPR